MKSDDIKRLSKTISQIENREGDYLKVLAKLYSQKRGVPILGITGLPGAGKSTLVDQIIQHLRKEGKTVAVLAVDPSSPFSGGAVLGDRVRMQRHAVDEGVFIRSLGSRGAHGGLSSAVRDLTLCLDAFGFDQILVETVGVGQTELDIMGLATTTVVVLVPEAGDTIQTIKAGLMEIADIFLVNKADLAGAKGMQTMLEAMVAMNHVASVDHHGVIEKVEVKSEKKKAWSPPVLLTEANKGAGVAELLESVAKHELALRNNPGESKLKASLRREQFLELCGEAAKQKMQQELAGGKKWKALLEAIAQEKINPYEALEEVLKGLTN